MNFQSNKESHTCGLDINITNTCWKLKKQTNTRTLHREIQVEDDDKSLWHIRTTYWETAVIPLALGCASTTLHFTRWGIDADINLSS